MKYKTSQRSGIELKDRVADISLQEQVRGYYKKPSKPGSFGEIIHCPASIELYSLWLKEEVEKNLGYEVNISIIDEEQKKDLLQSLKDDGFNDLTAKVRLMQIEDIIMKQKIAEHTFKNIPFYQQLELARDSAIKFLVRTREFSKEEAEDIYDAALSRELYRAGMIDEHGLKTDEAYAAAFTATHQTAPNTHERSRAREDESNGLMAYMLTKEEHIPVGASA